MRDLTIIIADSSAERFRCALSIVAAQAALGGKARIFLSGENVRIIRDPIQGDEDDGYASAGLPTLSELYAEALDMGVKIIACQSGMQMCDLTPGNFDPRVEYGGIVSVMQSLGDGRLIVV